MFMGRRQLNASLSFIISTLSKYAFITYSNKLVFGKCNLFKLLPDKVVVQ